MIDCAVRVAFALGVLTFVASVTACSGGVPRSHGVATGPRAAVRATPSGFVVEPGMSDPLCNGGRGLRLPAHLGGIPVVASATLTDGSALLAISDYSARRSVVLRSVTRRCAPSAGFGRHGIATIAISSGLPRARPNSLGAPSGLWVNAVAPRNGGGAIVAGGFGGHWVLGEVGRRGQLDSTFGNGGWTVLPFSGEATTIVQEPSGRIVIGGGVGGGCCRVNSVAALSSRGDLERAFGRHGRTELHVPTGEAGIDSLTRTPSGDILAAVGYGNNGCWGVALVKLTPSGHQVPLFAERTNRFWRRLGFSAFVGDIYTGPHGFTLTGTGQQPCSEGSLSSAPSATGLIIHFRTDGQLVGNPIRFPSRMYGDVRAFHARSDTFLVETQYADPTQVIVAAHRADGSLDASFGSGGRARIHTPWRGRYARLDTMVSINQANPTTIVVIAASPRRNVLQLIRVRL